ncbi:MAG: hypothetical protein AB8I08_14910 [Sandaracinaceae bacterium]
MSTGEEHAADAGAGSEWKWWAVAGLGVALLLEGCFAAPPAPAMATELGGCHPGSYGVLSALACRSDEDCVLCRTPEEACGVLVLRRELEIDNRVCPAVDVPRCRAEAACCEGRCVVSAGPPPL